MNDLVSRLGDVVGSGWSWPGAGLGVLMLAGLALVVAGLPMSRVPTLNDRLEPYLRDTPRPSSLLAGAPARTWPLRAPRAAAPLRRCAGGVVGGVLGGSTSVARRQQRAGQPADVDRFRAEQVLWGAIGGVAGLAVTSLIAVAQSSLSAPVLVGWWSSASSAASPGATTPCPASAARREARMLTEFPTVAELLASAVSAGEGAIGALERVCRLSRGELSDELRVCLADARAGANLPTALQGLADRTGLISLSRFVDGIVVAVERGTPLAEVLRAQAQDVREDSRRTLMEQGGKKEILMMIPVVFLILPVTVLFAVYPGVSFLRFQL